MLFAYDVALTIDLDRAARCVREGVEKGTLRQKRRTPTSFEFRPPPLRVVQAGSPLTIAGFETTPRVDCVVYDFGAVSVAYSIPLRGPLDGLLILSDALYENAALLSDSRQRVQKLLAAIAPAVHKLSISDLVEDYAIFQITSLRPETQGGDALPPGAVGPALSDRSLLRDHRHTLARILRAEPDELSEEEIDDALSSRLAYTPGELAILDWNAALLFQREGEDSRAVLEYANVELLELRRLDDQLDGVLDRSFAALNRRTVRGLLSFGPSRDLRTIAELQMDSSLLFEGVNNALKLVGDQYLARVYQMASRRLHLPDWDASIIRKLQTADSIYQKLSDHEASRRVEVLEWIIIVLIAFEVLMSLIR